MLFGRRRSIAGVLTGPDSGDGSNSRTAVLMLNAGMIHHAGPGRIYVKLARKLAAYGFTSVRFDFSGVGDSPVRTDNLPVTEIAVKEPQDVMDTLQAQGFERFILVGICSGAYCAFRTALDDERVSAAILVNTMSLDGELEMDNRVWEQRYLSQSLYSAQAWKNLLTGKVNYRRLAGTLLGKIKSLFRNHRQAGHSDQLTAEIRQLANRQQRLCFLFSGKDVAVNYLDVILGTELEALMANGTLYRSVLPEADHLFTRCEDH